MVSGVLSGYPAAAAAPVIGTGAKCSPVRCWWASFHKRVRNTVRTKFKTLPARRFVRAMPQQPS